ncbi:MAG: hypothetical protein K2X35_24930 [Bryobacteraceae bacterium]|nr:hypothetical protein [Bryobacteraceae bacterium]
MIAWIQGVAGFLLLMGLWLAVQSLLRKAYAAPREQDMLDDLTRGCGACGHDCAPRPCSGSPGGNHESR